jgi:hypothetical protein
MELFDNEWMNKYKDAWNAAPEVSGELAKVGFTTTIGVGFQDQPTAHAFVKVENGMIVHAGAYDGTPLDWDMRAKKDQWEKWMNDPPGMVGLGSAVTLGKLKFVTGDYGTMIKNPSLAGPFVKSFALMEKVK